MLAKRTAWSKRDRSNIESDLFIGNVNQHIDVIPDSRFNFGTSAFSYSLFVEYSNVSGFDFQINGGSMNVIIKHNASSILNVTWTNSLETIALTVIGGIFFGANLQDNKTHISVTYDGNDYILYVNGNVANTITSTAPNTGVNDLSGCTYVIGNRTNFLDAADGKLSHFSWFNRALTRQEINYIHRNGGLVPESAHENCVAHYPLTERYAFKADATFVAKHPQFVVGDNVFFDTIEQYNYAKVTPLAANHANAVNFTDDELGVVNPSTQVVKKDFYNKQTNYHLGLKNQVPQNQIRYNSPNTYISIGGDISFLCEITISEDISTDDNTMFLFSHGDFVSDYLSLRTAGLTTKIANVSTNYDFTDIKSLKKGDVIRIGFSYDSVTDEAILVRVINGIKEKESFSIPTWTSSNFTNLFGQAKNVNLKNYIGHLGILHGGVLPESDLYLWVDFKDIVTVPSSHLITSGIFDVDVDNTISDISGNGNTADFILTSGTGLTAWDTDKLKKGGESWVEKTTLLPEIKQAFQITSGLSIAKSYTAINQMSVSLHCPTNIAAITDIITGLPAIAKTFYNGVETASIVDDINTNSIAHITFQFSAVFTGTINYLFTTINWELIRFSGKTDKQSLKEIKRLTNNTLLSNSREEFESYHLMNEGSFSENGVNVFNDDLSGNANDVIILGLTGATSADKLADVPNHLIDVNQLR